MRARQQQRGFGLFDSLIALVILAFGLLAMTRLQGRTVQSATESQSRQKASQYADELISLAILDAPENRDCYTLPAVRTCPSAAAASAAATWSTATKAGMGAGTITTTSVVDLTSNRLTVTIGWTGKESEAERTLEAVTDVRVPPT